jgi:death-on-curing family protein
MINPLSQPPSSRLDVESCKKLYNAYLSETSHLFLLPSFEERYQGKLEGILGSVSQTFSGENLFPTIGKSAAAYFVKISTQHPFRDGNKRMAIFFTDAFLKHHDVVLNVGWESMYELAKFVVDEKESGQNPERLQALVEKILLQSR